MLWLSTLLWLPLVAALVIIAIPSEQPRVFRGIAVATGLIMLALSIAVTWLGAPMLATLPAGGFLFVESHAWMPQIGISQTGLSSGLLYFSWPHSHDTT